MKTSTMVKEVSAKVWTGHNLCSLRSETMFPHVLGEHVQKQKEKSVRFYVVRTVRFGMKLYNDQLNAQVFNLFIYLILPYMFRGFF
jgi:hypothetical protein